MNRVQDFSVAEPERLEEARTRSALLHMLEDLQRERDAIRLARRNWLDTVDAVRDAMMVHDAEYRVVRCNRAYAARAGMDVREVIGKTYWEMFPKGDGPLPGCRHVVQGLETAVDEEFRLPTGEVFISRSFPLATAGGKARQYLHVMQNVTERKRSEIALRQSEEHYRAMFDQAQVGMIQTSREGILLKVNPALCAMLGYSQSELTGRHFRELTFAEDVAGSEAVKASLNAGGESTGAAFEKQYVRKDGSPLWANVSVGAVRGADGKPEYFATIIQDISKRKAAQADLRFANTVMATQQEMSPDGILVVNDGGEILSFNRRFVEMWRIPDEVMQSRSGDRVLQSASGLLETPDALLDRVASLRGRNDTRVNQEFRLNDGRVLDVYGAPMEGSKGRNYGRVWYFRDITERKMAERAVRESEEKFRAIFDHSADGIALFTIDTRAIKFANKGMERLLGYEGGELTDMPVVGLLPPERAAAILLEFDRGAAGDSGGARDIEMQRKDGKPVYVDITGALVSIGAARYLLGAFRDATDRRAAEKKLRRVNRALKTLSAGNEALVRATDEAGLLNEMTRILNETGGYPVAFVSYALDDAYKTLEPKAARGVGLDAFAPYRASWADNEHGQSMNGLAVRLGQTQHVRDPVSSPGHAPWRELLQAKNIHALLGLPLRAAAGERPFGAMGIATGAADGFDADEIRLLEELAGDLAYGIVTLRAGVEQRAAGAKLRRSLEGTIGAVAATMESRDPYTAGHQRRVATLASAIATEMGLSAAAAEGIHFGALIHDLGKIQVPAEILSKPTRLSRIEFELIKEHARAGYEIIKGIDFPWPIALMVLQHHERLDGSGYPQGLKGEEMAPEARILAVADVVEAMSSHRPYRAGLGIDAALKEIEQKRGTWFDAAAVDACLRLFREKQFVFESR